MSNSRNELQNIDQKFIEEAALIAEAFPQFIDGIRILMLIQRHSDGGHTNNSKLRTYISKGKDDWIRSLAKLLQEKSHYPEIPLRIYQTVNSRDLRKGSYQFKHSMVDADYYDEAQRDWFYLDIKNRMVSALMKPASRAESHFLIDFDSQDLEELTRVQSKLELVTEIVGKYQTKNGFHFIVKPFNPADILDILDSKVELKKDAMMLLKY